MYVSRDLLLSSLFFFFILYNFLLHQSVPLYIYIHIYRIYTYIYISLNRVYIYRMPASNVLWTIVYTSRWSATSRPCAYVARGRTCSRRISPSWCNTGIGNGALYRTGNGNGFSCRRAWCNHCYTAGNKTFSSARNFERRHCRASGPSKKRRLATGEGEGGEALDGNRPPPRRGTTRPASAAAANTWRNLFPVADNPLRRHPASISLLLSFQGECTTNVTGRTYSDLEKRIEFLFQVIRKNNRLGMETNELTTLQRNTIFFVLCFFCFFFFSLHPCSFKSYFRFSNEIDEFSFLLCSIFFFLFSLFFSRFVYCLV